MRSWCGGSWMRIVRPLSQQRYWVRTSPRRFRPGVEALEERSLLSFAAIAGPSALGADSVALADLNGDGQPDAVVAHRYDNQVAVALGNGDGTFQSEQIIAASGKPFLRVKAIVTGDLNVDHKVDIVTVDEVGSVKILLGNGDGSFAAGQTLEAGGGSHSAVLGDFNHDGKVDLTVAVRDLNSVALFVGNDDGTFQPATMLGAGQSPYGVVAADVNGDGNSDLIVPNFDSKNSITVLVGNGDGSFAVRPVLVPIQSPAYVAAADFNGDGMPDIAVATVWGNQFSVLLGDGKGDFQPKTSYFASGTVDITSLDLGDLNHDGAPDLIVSDNRRTHIYLNNGTGPFQDPWALPSPDALVITTGSPGPVAVVDLNGDGNADIVNGNKVLLNTPTPPKLIVNPLGQSDRGELVSPEVYVGESLTLTVTALDSYGKMINDYAGTVSFSSTDGLADLPASYTFSADDRGAHAFTCAFNSPADQTITVTDSTGSMRAFAEAIVVSQARGPSISSNNDFSAEGNFTTGGLHSSQIPAFVVGAADFTNDGKQDLVFVHYQQDLVGILPGNGDGSFQSETTLSVGSRPIVAVIGDFNGDHNADLAVINRNPAGNAGSVSILLGNGDGTFQSQLPLLVGQYPSGAAIGDWNDDGQLDLVVTNQGSDTVDVFLGNGDGTFQNPILRTTGHGPSSVAVGDFNSDGRSDLIVADTYDDSVAVFVGNGNGTFQDPLVVADIPRPTDLAIADFNRDGKLDVAISSRSNTGFSILWGDGAGGFPTEQSFASEYSIIAIATGDFDNDGQPDLEVTDEYYTRLYMNSGNGFDPSPLTIYSGRSPSSIALGDFNGDNKTDLAIAYIYRSGAPFQYETQLNTPVADHFLVGLPMMLGGSGGTVNVTVTARESYGRVITDYQGSVHFSSTSDSIVLPDDYTFTASDQGIHTFSVNIVNRKSETITVADDTASLKGTGYVYFIQSGAPDFVISAVGLGTNGILNLDNGNNHAESVSTAFSNPHPSLLAVGADAGGGPNVVVYDAQTKAIKFSFFAYNPAFIGGVRVAVGDLNGDGMPDIVTAPGPGGGPDVHVYDGKTGLLLQQFMAFDAAFNGGLSVAVADINADGFDDIVVGADAGGGPNVVVFDSQAVHTGQPRTLMNFFAFDPRFIGGVRVAAGDVDGDGRADLVVAAGPGGGPNVIVFSGATGNPLTSFFAFDARFAGGVSTALADLNGDGHADIIVGAGAGGGPNVKVFSGADNSVLMNFFAFDPAFTGGVRPAALDRHGDGHADIVTGAGPGGGPDVRLIDGTTMQQIDHFFAFDPLFAAGVFVGGNGTK